MLGTIGSHLAGSVGGSGALATAGGAALATAGIAGTAYGIQQTMTEAKQGDTGAAIGTGIGTAAIAGGTAFALLASNPVGWAVAAVGGAVMVITDLVDDAMENGNIMDQLNEASKQRLDDLKEQHYEEISDLEAVRQEIEDATSVSEAKRILEEEGIASKEELSKAEYDNIDALVALTDQYIASTNELNSATEGMAHDLENKQNEQQNKISEDMWALSKKKVEDMTDEEKAAMGDFMEDYYWWMKKKADSGDEDAAYRIKEWEKYGNNLTDGIVSQDDLNAINSLNTTHYGDNDTTAELFKEFMSDDANTTKITTNKSVQAVLGLDGSFKRIDAQAYSFVEQAAKSKSAESAKSLLAQAKALGLTYELLTSIEDGKTLMQAITDTHGITSYRVGTDSIPYDNYPALLHEGEAVLTASTANELRSLVDEYRETKNDSARISQAIENQTTILVAKLDAIYSKMPDNDSTLAETIMPGQLSQNAKSMTSAFNMFN